MRRTGISVSYGPNLIPFQIPPYIVGGHTLCQVRPLAEALGAQVTWEQVSQIVTIRRGDRAAQCQVGSEVAIVGDRGYSLPEPPMLVDGHVIVPLRFVSEALGARVDWHEQDGHITLSEP